jgi:uncharacterized protein (TIGR02147 family)
MSLGTTSPSSPGQFLRAVFFQRTQRNSHYSMRAFARDLDVSHSYLSQIFNDKRCLHPKRAEALAARLSLDASSAACFLESVRTSFWRDRSGATGHAGKAKPVEFFQLELDRFKVLSEWYHLAILDFTELADFKPSASWISRRLGVKVSEVRGAVRRLERLGLLQVTERGWRKTHSLLTVPSHHPGAAVRKFHRQMIEKALEALRSDSSEDYDARHIMGTVMAIDKSRLPEAKRRVTKFSRSLLRYLTSGNPSDLYQLNIQLFPLAKKGKRRAL